MRSTPNKSIPLKQFNIDLNKRKKLAKNSTGEDELINDQTVYVPTGEFIDATAIRPNTYSQ